MKKINKNLLSLDKNKKFSDVSKKVNEFKLNNPKIKLISLGIGDVSLPIVRPVIDAMHNAVEDLSDIKTFRGYGAHSGYDFLKDKILANDYKDFNFSYDELYISCGTKTDVTNILELFDTKCKVAIPSIIYPIYKYGATCFNRNVSVLNVDRNNNFYPNIPNKKYDIIYLCAPNNPIGNAYSSEELKKWIEYAIKNDSVILYDNVYCSFISSMDKPKSIYEIENSKKVAIEFRSFSKTASFTGVRCSYYVIPNELHKDVNKLWKNRTVNRFNGTDYIAQRGAEATYLPESKSLISENIKYYLENAKLLTEAFSNLGFEFMGGIDSPYLWVKIKGKNKSWSYFEEILDKVHVVIIPGIVFGKDGDSYFRVSALGNREDIKEATKRLEKYYE